MREWEELAKLRKETQKLTERWHKKIEKHPFTRPVDDEDDTEFRVTKMDNRFKEKDED